MEFQSNLRLFVFLSCVTFSFAQNVTFPQSGIGPCNCDLTSSACDIGCCCDSDCTSADISAFLTSCVAYSFQNIQTCVPNHILFRYNSPDKVNTTDATKVCFYKDSFTARNSYTAPVLVTNVTQIRRILQAYTGYTFPITAQALVNGAPTIAYYKQSDPIYTFYPTNSIGYLTLPILGPGNACGDEMEVEFLVNRSVSCTRTVATLDTTCTTDGFLSISNYISTFKIMKKPGTFQETLNVTHVTAGGVTTTTLPVAYDNATGLLTITATNVTCETGGVCNTTSLVPEYNATSAQCDNVLKSLLYTITHDGSNGIDTVAATVVLGSLASTATSFTQTIAVDFISKNGTAGSPRSGNPGYIVDKPVLAGKLSSTSNAIITNGAPSTQLTVPSGGACSLTTTRTTVLFGVSMITGCTITITKNITSQCATLETQILQFLEGTSFPTRIATFGNSLTTNPEDWLPISTTGRTLTGSPTNFPGGCSQIVIGAELTIITSRVGSVTNPQNRILGAAMKYVRGDIKFTCFDPACSATQETVPISMSVSFIDTSKTGGPQASTDPLVLTQFKSDFLYAFRVEDLSKL